MSIDLPGSVPRTTDEASTEPGEASAVEPTADLSPDGGSATTERSFGLSDAAEAVENGNPPSEDRRSWFEHLRPCEIRWVGVELPRAHPEVVLTEVDPPHRSLRFPIGYPEGIAISVAIRGVELPRPLTHDFLSEVLRRLQVRVEALRILGMAQGNLVADIMLIGNQGSPMLVPCRPSDGLALVTRAQVPVPILVHEELLSFAQ